MKPPIHYYGGKAYQAEWICDVFRQYKFHTYIEPFGGSGAILFAKPPSPVEIYNDIHSDLVNFYKVLRDRDTFDAFTYFVENSPYARETFYESREIIRTDVHTSDVERAGHFFITIRQSFSGCQCSWSSQGKAGLLLARYYRNAIDRLPEVHNRLRDVHIEHLDAIECIKRHASDDRTTMTYCDPPYIADTRTAPDVYTHELTDEQHKVLVQTLLTVPGHKILSGYKSPLYQPLLDAGWSCLERDYTCYAALLKPSGERTTRTECLYCSPNTKPKTNLTFSTNNKQIR